MRLISALYDGEFDEPVLLPSGFPNSFANGAHVSLLAWPPIPPHNILELISASLHLIKHPSASIETLMKFVKGPDFPTGGGILVESAENIRQAILVVRAFRLRATYEIEREKGGQWQIITEIPIRCKNPA